MSIEAMKKALDALRKADAVIYSEYCGTDCEELQICEPAIKALEEAIAEAEKQEPDDLTIAYMSGYHDGKKAQPKREPLTDEQCDAIYDALDEWARVIDDYSLGLPQISGGGKEGARPIIRAAHGIKGEA